jgi:NADH dehydrogenase [ubiquinone] 1 alpha subcomplex assembly factor 7
MSDELLFGLGDDDEEDGEGEGALAVRLRERLRAHGPISLHDYMDACLADPDFGYYRVRQPFGLSGDFITAPDICQAFGELLGLWCVHVWAELGQPAGVRLIELGPGRGALMSDALRAAYLVPPFLDAVSVHLVETSPSLREAQAERIRAEARDHQRPIPELHWHDRLEDVPEGPSLVIANEFVDALPIRQFQLTGDRWHERMVALDDAGRFVYALAAEPLDDTSLLPPAQASAKEGDLIELRPGQSNLIGALAARAGRAPLAGLIIDYGYSQPALGDSFQAVRAHDYADPLQHPGLCDLTAHVDFSELKRHATAAGLATHGPVSQRDFLVALGIRERAAQLMQSMESIQQAHRFVSGLQRLIEPKEMGTLFKAMALTGADQPPVPGFEPDGPAAG